MLQRELINAYVGIGANLGESQLQLEAAISAMTRLPDT